MSKKVIHLGGQVTASGAPHLKVDGIAIELLGDAYCSKRGHGDCTIAVGDSEHTINGVPVAYEGHLTSCGARLIATVANFSKA